MVEDVQVQTWHRWYLPTSLNEGRGNRVVWLHQWSGCRSPSQEGSCMTEMAKTRTWKNVLTKSRLPCLDDVDVVLLIGLPSCWLVGTSNGLVSWFVV
jgi:hypothetical protein